VRREREPDGPDFRCCRGDEGRPLEAGVVYCKDSNRRGNYPRIQFTFLGFTFRPRRAKARDGKWWTNFLPAVSAAAMKRMYQRIREWHIPRQTSVALYELAAHYNPTLRGWLNYYGRFYRSALQRIFFHFEGRLLQWARRKCRNRFCASIDRCDRSTKPHQRTTSAAN
jgi:RNA-directed DNA polymerase